ncbi:MAG: MaoC family dehydratase [Alphaproteobacteria bacterium]|nr:MaoC family dehydratase [Alphaproteobacteria bacterium]
MDLKAGDTIPDWVMESVSAARMRTMAAILRDPNPVHWDREAVNKLGMGLGRRTINQGPLGLSYMVNMIHEWAGPGSLERLYMTFPKVLLDGDHITAKGKVTDVKEDDKGKLAVCDVWLERKGETEPLLKGEAHVRLKS